MIFLSLGEVAVHAILALYLSFFSFSSLSESIFLMELERFTGIYLRESSVGFDLIRGVLSIRSS